MHADPMETRSPSSQEPRRADRDRQGMLQTAAKALLGVGLLLAVLSLTLLRSPANTDPHGALTSGPPSTDAAVLTASTEAPTTTVSLTPLEQAQKDGDRLAVEAAVDQLRVYDRVPPGSNLTRTFPRKGEFEVTATFLVESEALDDRGDLWFEIHLPVRPNGSRGWVRAAEVKPLTMRHELRIDLSEHRLDLYERGAKIRSYPIGVGKGDTPSPVGTFYVAVKVKPANPNSVYGVLIMALSGFSEKLTDWPGGGQAGIHGTNDPSKVGTDVSNGCIRMRNADILELTNFAPLGTPVVIQE